MTSSLSSPLGTKQVPNRRVGRRRRGRAREGEKRAACDCRDETVCYAGKDSPGRYDDVCGVVASALVCVAEKRFFLSSL